MVKRIIRSISVLLIAFSISATLHFQQVNKYKDWSVTQGKLYNIEQVHSKYSHSSSSISYRLYYTYKVDDIEYTGVDSYSGQIPEQYHIGKIVKVMYDTNNPIASLHERPKTSLITRIPILWSLPIALIMLLPMKKRKSKKQDFWTEMEKRGMSKEDAKNILNKRKK